jgi:putative spermidine/putrescine transport system permease protein
MQTTLFGFARGLVVALTALFLVAPIFIIVPVSLTGSTVLQLPWDGISLRWYQSALANPLWRNAIWNSAVVACCTMTLSAGIGTLAAVGIAESSNRIAKILRSFFIAPIVAPVIVLAIGIYMVLVRIHMSGTMLGLVVAHSVLATPFVVVTVLSALQGMNPNLQLASLGLGASRVRTFLRITVPLLFPAILSGSVLAFVISWDEVVVAIFLTTPRLTTAPVLIWQYVKFNITPEIAAVGTMLVLVSIAVLAVSQLGKHLLTRRG